MTFVFFGAKRALDYIIGSIQCVPVSANNYKTTTGLSVSGFVGAGGIGTVDTLLGRPMTKLADAKACKSKEHMHLYLAFKTTYGEKIEEVARKHLGILTAFSFVTWANFEHILCEYRKYLTFKGNLEKAPVYSTSPEYRSLLVYRA